MVGGIHPYIQLSSTMNYKTHHKIVVLHRQPWMDIFIDHFHWPNIIIGILEGIHVNYFHVYAQSNFCTSFLKLSCHLSSIFFMAIEYVGIHMTLGSLQCEAYHPFNMATSLQ